MTLTSEVFALLMVATIGLEIVLLAMLLRERAARRRERSEWLNEVSRELEAVQESTLNAVERMAGLLTGTSQTQSEQVNAALRQSYDTALAFDQRQQAMQRITEESLRRIETRMQAGEASSAQRLAQNDARMEQLRKALEEGMRTLRTENTQKLEEMRKTVDEKLQGTLEKRLNDSFAQVSTRLEQVYRSLGEVHTLASGVGDLKRMLGNVKTRGVWGEVQLGALLEQSLTQSQYERNVAVVPGSQERVEFAVRLPGQGDGHPVYLPIDSKFPQEDYARLTEAAQNGDRDATEAARKALLAAVRTEAKRIGKYIAPPYSTDFAVMFLPLEGLYAEVMSNADVAQQIQREQRVLIAGPSTLLALLNSLQMGFRTLAIEQRSAEVWKLLGAVKADFGSFAQVLQKTQEKLRQATDTIDSAFTKTRTIERKLRGVEALESEEEAKKLLEE